MSQYPEEHRAALAAMNFKSPADLSAKLLDYDKTFGQSHVAVPKDWAKASAEEKAAWRTAHSVPAKAEEYLKDVKTEGIADFNQRAFDWFRQTAHELGIPPFLAAPLLEKWNAFAGELGGELGRSESEAAQREDDGLRREWGAQYDANMDLAREAARHFGFTKQDADALQKTVGYARVMKGFLNYAKASGEDYIRPTGGAPGSGFISTPEQARAEKDRMIADPAIAKILREPNLRNPEHKALVEKFDRLQQIESGVKLG
jgi:hypothetical protein